MSQRTREIVFLILQFLDEEKFKETVHKLEQESGFFFNLKYFEDEVHNGNWEEVERYLSGFTKVDDNRYSMKIFFEIRKQKYLEALDKHDRYKAVDILVKDLKVFATFNEELFKEITQLLTLENFRENEQLSKYGDTKSARAIMLVELKKLFEANPLFRDKLQFPNLKNSRLRTLINQSLNWEHQLCKNPRPNPDIKTLFVDHSCGQPNGACAPSPANNLLMGSLPKAGGFPPLGAHGPRMVLPFSRDLVFLILQFLNEQEFKETLHKLEEESGFFFNMSYFEDEANPIFHDKLQFPYLKPSRLRTLIDQSLNWQHQLCKNPRPNPDIKTLFVDHSCGQPNGARASSPAKNPLLGSLLKAGGFPPLGAHGPFQPTPAPVPTPLAGWMSSPSTVTHPAVSGGAIGLGAPSIPAALKHPSTPPTNPSIDYPSGDSDHVSKRTGPMGIPDEVNLPVNVLPVTFQGHGHSQAFNAPDDLPKTVTRTLNQGSSPMSMDFHPVQQTLLLVGTNVGDIGLWEVGSRERLVLKNFEVWDVGACTMSLQSALVKDPGLSVNRVTWSPDGSLFGVAYSRHIVQIYSYHGADDVRQHLEIDAHVGGVNDLAFSHPNKQLCVITCGDDKTIKVWDAATGVKQYTFEGHEAPVYSVCPHYNENIQFIFSTALDGKIKAWLYDNLGSQVDYDAPGSWCTTMAYSADGTRLFSCGTSKDGESYIVEWNQSEGAVKRTYQGFRKRSLGVVQFDTTRNRFLAAGDDFSIKFWDMDNVQLLTTTDADGGLSASPRIRFNKDGTLLAVSGNDNVIKILANTDGIRLLHTFENLSYDASRTSETVTKPMINPISAAVAAASASSAGLADTVSSVVTIAGMNGDTRNLGDVKPRIIEETNDKSKIWKLTEFNEPSQCRSLRLPENMRITKVNVLPVTSPGHGQNEAFNTPDDLPKIVKRTLNQGSSPTSMDFHPVQPTVLLVGTKVGDIGLWEVGSGKTFVLRNFKVWDLGKCSMSVQAALVKDPSLSVNCVTWSPEGSLFGVAYSKHIVQIYSYHGDNDVRQHMEIDAHVGGVNDLAFSHPNEQLVIITCGDDKTIKVWDAVTGAKQYTFEGHEAPVYSVCPHYKKNIPFIFSTAVDGKIKAWLYDNLGSRVDFDAPGHWCTTMAYSTDGTRLFSCGTSKEGESYIVEWNESEGAVKRNYQGFQKRSLGVVQFDTTRNRFLAAGDDFSIKFWNMDNVQLLTTIDADGGLPACPRICFNKDGTLLAVSTYENGIKILANSDGIQLLRASEYLSYNASRTSEMVTKPAINPISAVATSATIARLADKVSSVVAIAGMKGDNINLEDVKPGLSEETNNKSKKLTDITEPSQFQSFKLSENVKLTKSRSLKPSDDCKFAYMSPTVWNKLAHGSRKAAVLENVKGDWKKVAIVFLVFLIIIYSFGFCPFKRSNSEDNAYLRWKRYP